MHAIKSFLIQKEGIKPVQRSIMKLLAIAVELFSGTL